MIGDVQNTSAFGVITYLLLEENDRVTCFSGKIAEKVRFSVSFFVRYFLFDWTLVVNLNRFCFGNIIGIFFEAIINIFSDFPQSAV